MTNARGTPETACVVIPLYKKELDCTEQIALDRAFDVFAGNHSLAFVAPKELQAEAMSQKEAPVRRFDPFYFKDRHGYNKLLLSKEFYDSFREYEHILIYQLDAYVFQDQLEDWCREGIDYIGAPWFEAFAFAPTNDQLWAAGNGGFSLRNVDACLRVLDQVTIFNLPSTKLHSQVARYQPTCWWQMSLPLQESHLCVGVRGNEDVFWAMYAPQIDDDFRVGTIEEALRFSFEAQPRTMYAKNDKQLPFGCHAWEKHDPEFWSSFIGEV